MIAEFRVHHILCTALYVGEGYSGAFCENMTAVVRRLRKNPAEPLKLVTAPDIICRNCPNRTKKGECSQDKNHVVQKDRLLLKELDFKEDAVYTYEQLCRQTSAKMTKEIFQAGCGNCCWYKEGLCTYEKLAQSIVSQIISSSY